MSASTTPPFHDDVGNRPREQLKLETLAADARAGLAGACTGQRAVIRVGSIQRGAAAVDVLTKKLRPLNVFSWKSRNTSWNSAKFRSMPRPWYLKPASRASLISGLNSRSAPDAIRPWQPVWTTLAQIAPLPESGGIGQHRCPRCCGHRRRDCLRTPKCGSIEVESAGFVTARIARVGKQPISWLDSSVPRCRRTFDSVFESLIVKLPPGALGITHGNCCKRRHPRSTGTACCCQGGTRRGLLLVRVAARPTSASTGR